MARNRQLILNRYQPLAEAGAGGFGVVQVAWDTRIQRKVAIKCIELSEVDVARVAQPDAETASARSQMNGSELDGAADTQSTWDDADEANPSSPTLQHADASTARTFSWDDDDADAALFGAAPTRAIEDIPPWEDLPDADAVDVHGGGRGSGWDSDVPDAWRDSEAGAASGAAFADASDPFADLAAPGSPTRVLSPRTLADADAAPARARAAAPVPDTEGGIFSWDGLPQHGESISLTGSLSAPLAHTLTRIPGLDEARTAALLSDANIVTVYDFEVQGSTAYLIMEYVEGMTLAELLREHADELTLDVAAAVLSGVAHAIEVAHEAGVLHLDIKPDNVLIDMKGQVKVTDFGLATLADASGFASAGGGTIGYMPLEQMREEPLDVRCDEWALASVAYEMLAGENPFLAPDLPRAEAAIEDAELVLPSLCWDELDEAADDVLFYALDPDREERYETVADFAEELEPLLGDAKRGKRELARIVNPPEDAEAAPTALAEPRPPRIPLRERITPLQRRIASHAIGAAGSALVSLVALANIPQTAGAENPLFWGLLALFALAGALRPRLGALCSYVALAAMLIMQDAPAAGCLLLAAVCVWWYFVGRASDREANAALAAQMAGAVGGAQAGPLVAGFCLRPVHAMATALIAAFVALLLAVGTHSLLGWDALAYWNFTTRIDAADSLAALVVQPAPWCIALSWPVAAGACAVLRLRPTRAFAVFGVLVGTAVLVAGICLAAGVASGGVTWLPSVANLVGTLVPAAVVLAACALVPDPVYDAGDDE